MDYVIIHYSEIALRKKNRAFFEKKLMQNIETALQPFLKKVIRRYGKIICILKKKETKKVTSTLERIPGIAYFSFALECKLDLNDIEKNSLTLLEKESFKTFKVDAKRTNKNFSLNSMQLNAKLGETILTKMKKKVDVHTPDLKLFVEICEKEAFVYCKKYRAIGGLPVSTAGKVICSLSGGLDSPVSSYLTMKRGCKVIFVHIFNNAIANEAVLKKVEDLTAHLTKFQLSSKLYCVPFKEIQAEIIKNVPAKFRMIIYRRFMMRICNEIAQKENAKAIVTGDSIGQVASQTLENLNCIYDASTLPVFPPLIGLNKEEITEISKKIETYEQSILPYPDCCSFMIAEHPATKASLEDILKFEKLIKNKEKLVKQAIAKAELKSFKFP